MSTNPKPYLIRAVYEWLVDNDETPHILVSPKHGTRMPPQFTENTTFNISMQACRHLEMENEFISFHAKFGGKPFSVYVPMKSVLGIFAKDGMKGMGFEEEPETDDLDLPDSPPTPPEKKKPSLKIVK